MADLPALREALAQMTGGEWTLDASPGDEACVATVAPGRGQLFLCTMDEDDTTQAERDNNAAGIVALRNAAPALLDELEAARANYSDIAELLFGEAEYEHDDVRLRVVAILDELEAARAENAALHQRPCPCCGATAEDYPATLETADHIAGLSNMVEDARERKGET